MGIFRMLNDLISFFKYACFIIMVIPQSTFSFGNIYIAGVLWTFFLQSCPDRWKKEDSGGKVVETYTTTDDCEQKNCMSS